VGDVLCIARAAAANPRLIDFIVWKWPGVTATALVSCWFSRAGSEGSQASEKEKEEEKLPELPLLSDQLSLDELWDMLGECLKELEESHDQHAVLGELGADSVVVQQEGIARIIQCILDNKFFRFLRSMLSY